MSLRKVVGSVSLSTAADCRGRVLGGHMDMAAREHHLHTGVKPRADI